MLFLRRLRVHKGNANFSAVPRGSHVRAFKSHHIRKLATTPTYQHSRRRPIDETTLGSAQHKPSLSGPSLGHLISELSATSPQMLEDGIRVEGQMMNEADRTMARKVAIALVGLPLALGTVWVGWGYAVAWRKDHNSQKNAV